MSAAINQPTPNVVIETIYSSSVCDLVLQGAGIGLVNAYSAHQYRLHPIVFKPFRPEVGIRSLLLFPPDRQQSRLVNRFVAALMGARNTIFAEGKTGPGRARVRP